EASWEDLPLASLADLLRPGLLSGGHSSGTLSAEGLAADFSVDLHDGVIDWPRLDAAPVGPWSLRLEGQARWLPEARAVELSDGTLWLGAGRSVRMPVRAHLPLAPDAPFSVAAALPPTQLQRLARSLPGALAPHEELKGVEGPISA